MKASLCIFAYESKERGSSFPGHRSITSLTTINEVSASKKNPFQNRDLQQLVGVSEWSIKRGRLSELTGMMVDANLGTQRNVCWLLRFGEHCMVVSYLEEKPVSEERLNLLRQSLKVSFP